MKTTRTTQNIAAAIPFLRHCETQPLLGHHSPEVLCNLIKSQARRLFISDTEYSSSYSLEFMQYMSLVYGDYAVLENDSLEKVNELIESLEITGPDVYIGLKAYAQLK